MDSPFCFLLYCLDSFSAFLQDFLQFILLVGPKHGDTGLLEVRDSLEDRGGGQMATGVENASILVDALDIDAELLFQKVDFLIYGQWGGTGIVEIITDFLENPWSSEVARPIITASTPYLSKASLASSGVVISPLPMIGI